VDIRPEDDKNSQLIMDQIRQEKITDEATIRRIVESYSFSSPKPPVPVSSQILSKDINGKSLKYLKHSHS
jgi:hypothetical protein